MKRLPFPAELARISADGARAHMDLHLPPGSYSREGAAAYRTRDGKIGLAYDPYSPEYPEGSEPGLATGHHRLEHYPNETSGYVSHATNFMSVADLRLGGMKIDETCAGIMDLGGKATMVVVDGPDEMCALAERVESAGGKFHPGVINTRKLPMNEDLQVFVSAKAVGGMEVFAAPDMETLAVIARDRYRFINAGLDATEFFDNLQAHGEKHGWLVCFGDRDECGPETERRLREHEQEPEF